MAAIFQAAGIQDICEYYYWDDKQRGVCLKKLLEDLERAPERSVVVLSASAHYPTGADLSQNQWAVITQLIMVTDMYIYALLQRLKLFIYQTSSSSFLLKSSFAVSALFPQRRRLFPFLLLPAQALCYGDLERDAWPVQYCASLGMELLCAQSFSHCFGLYGEKVILKEFYSFQGCMCVTPMATGTPNVKMNTTTNTSN